MTQRQSRKQKQQLEKRLSAYSLAAASLLLGAYKAEATIHYDHIDPDAILMNDDEVFNVQFAGETKFQIRFNKNTWTARSTTRTTQVPTAWSSIYPFSTIGWSTRRYYHTNYFTSAKVGVFPATGNAFVGSGAYASAMNGGATIGSSKSFNGAGSSANMASFSNYWYSYRGNFRGTSDRFLGVRFDLGGNTHYGWVQVSIPSDVSSATITGLAYEDVTGLAILAGEQDTSLPVALSAFSAAVNGNSVRLNWTTESETDHAGFVLSRRVLNQDGSPAGPWTEIASYRTYDALRASGNSTSKKDYSFIDVNTERNTVYEYLLSDIDTRGKTDSQRLICVDTQALIPSDFAVYQNFPNPFNPETAVRFDLPEQASVQVSVYDVRGRKVAVLVDGVMQAGSHELKWNAADQGSGTYFCEVRAGDNRGILKLMLMR